MTILFFFFKLKCTKLEPLTFDFPKSNKMFKISIRIA